jgi:hypothetical protein
MSSDNMMDIDIPEDQAIFAESENIIESDIETIYTDLETKSVIEIIQNLIIKYGLKKVLDIIEPIYLIYNAEEFFSDKEKIEMYIKSLNKIFAYHKQLTNVLFVIYKRFPVISANGRISIIRVKKSLENTPLLLVKEPLRKESDPISYEYYIGLTLNQLKLNYNIPSFPIVFSKINFNNRNLILYEYIRDRNETTLSLYKYIKQELNTNDINIDNTHKQSKRYINYKLQKLELNVLYMLIFLLITLQIAQDKFDFTHYDLHLNNILLIKLNKTYKFQIIYDNNNFDIYLDYMPYIIDYGRSHINPNTAFSYEKHFIDDKNRVYTSFDSYQDDLWANNNKYIIKKQLTLSKINNLINQIRLQKGYLPDNEIILNQYYYLIPGTTDIYPFKPDVFNPKYDFYKLTRSINSMFLSVKDKLSISPFWNTLDTLLLNSYPFYIPNSYNLPKSYSSFTNRFNTPIEIAIYINNILYRDIQPSYTTYDILPFSINQLAGAKIKTEKFKMKELKPYDMSKQNTKKSILDNKDNIDDSSIIKSVYKLKKSEKSILYTQVYKQISKKIEDVNDLQLHNIDDYSQVEHFSVMPDD